MLHLWLVLYGVDKPGRMVMEAFFQHEAAGNCRLGLGIVEAEKIDQLPPMMAGFAILADRKNVQMSSGTFTHMLVVAFVGGRETAVLEMALSAGLQRRSIEGEILVQDHHPRSNPVPPQMVGTLAYYLEFWLRPGENGGKPTIELPIPPGPSN